MSIVHSDSTYPIAGPYLTISKGPQNLPRERKLLETESESSLRLCLEESPPKNVSQSMFAPTKKEMKERMNACALCIPGTPPGLKDSYVFKCFTPESLHA